MSDGLPSWYDSWRIGDPGRSLGRHERECGDCEGTGTAENDQDPCSACDGSGIEELDPDLG